ncbi:hypothetical protein EDD37DRAFT_290521 [Exophiala viscosa]|uniref:uncharacterized protein n=1 Tax=Exophiala viscosa TaxID=2486360 RepID=UPI002194314B|nr:hypothetical protein EDD37DRAFT_290521 [Exophiala viscosa]
MPVRLATHRARLFHSQEIPRSYSQLPSKMTTLFSDKDSLRLHSIMSPCSNKFLRSTHHKAPWPLHLRGDTRLSKTYRGLGLACDWPSALIQRLDAHRLQAQGTKVSCFFGPRIFVSAHDHCVRLRVLPLISQRPPQVLCPKECHFQGFAILRTVYPACAWRYAQHAPFPREFRRRWCSLMHMLQIRWTVPALTAFHQRETHSPRL